MKWTFLRSHFLNGRHHKVGDSADHLDNADIEHLTAVGAVGKATAKPKPEPKADVKGGK